MCEFVHTTFLVREYNAEDYIVVTTFTIFLRASVYSLLTTLVHSHRHIGRNGLTLIENSFFGRQSS